MWVGKFALSDEGLPAGGVAWVDLGTTAAVAPAVVNGAAYHPTYSSVDGISALYVTTEAVAASDTYIGGFRYRSDGALRVYDATSAVPAGSNTNQGIALTSDGQLCYTTGNTTSFSLNGVAVDTERRVYAAPLAFELQFADAGAGVVSTVEAIGAITPTFTRATTATTVLSTGLIGSVASGSPRSYYDPTSLTYLGYLAEGARTNLCLQSEDFNTTWVKAATLTVSTNTDVAPDGATTADTLSNVTDFHALTRAFSVAADTTSYTVSFFVKKTSGASTFPGFSIQLSPSATVYSASINTDTGVITGRSTEPPDAVNSKEYLGYWRISITGANDSSTTLQLAIYPAVNTDGGATWTGGVGSVVVWGAQLEAAAFASSYIPTTTLAVVRNADVLTYPTSPWFNAAAGTFFAQWTPVSPAAAAALEHVCGVNDGTANERIVIRRANDGSGTNQMIVTDGGVTQAACSGAATVAGTTYKLAGAYAVNDFAFCQAGGTVATDVSGTLPTVTTLDIGSQIGNNFANGPIRRVTYYGARLANATLQALTA